MPQAERNTRMDQTGKANAGRRGLLRRVLPLVLLVAAAAFVSATRG